MDGSFGTMRPLSESDYDELANWLTMVSPLDLDGVLGLLHSIALAPSLIPPSTWLPIVVPEGFRSLQGDDIRRFADVILRLHGAVQEAVNHQQAIMPEADDVEECESFAAGYVLGAELDPEWVGRRDRWTLVMPVAYLAGRLELLTPEAIEDIERDLGPDPKAILRRNLEPLMLATDEAFREVRKAMFADPATMSRRVGGPRVGRNDVCPCGSGKKYKRCCIRSELRVQSE